MQKKRSSAPRRRRQMPAWQVALVDVLLLAVCLVVFALFDHVIPSWQQAVPVAAIATPVPTAVPTPVPAQETEAEAEAEPVVEATPTPEPAVGDFTARFPDKFTDGQVIQTENTYQSANINLTFTRNETIVQEDYNVVYFLADVYVRNIECLRTLLADDSYGKSINEDVISMSTRCGALVAMNSDYYSFRSTGTVIRNGTMYRGGVSPDMEVAILFRDGTMRAYKTEAELNMDQVMADGAWQGFCFGPSLLDENGNLWDDYESVNHNPRTILGMIEPGHYLFIVIDGRQGSYSEGMTYRESAELCRQLGCKFAFNLDGGKTTQMTYMGKMANKPYKGGRDTSDIIYIGEPNA